jgi:hypothetical protein
MSDETTYERDEPQDDQSYVDLYRLSCRRNHKNNLVRRLQDGTLITIFTKRERTLEYRLTYRTSLFRPGEPVLYLPGNHYSEDGAIRSAIRYLDSAGINWASPDFKAVLGDPLAGEE